MTNPMLIDLPMPITTRRLLIRPREPGEGSAMAAAVNDSLAELKPWMLWAQAKQDPEGAEIRVREMITNWIERTELAMTICDRGSGKIIGSSGFHAINWRVPRFEIGYWVRTGHTNQGVASECVEGLTIFAFEVLGAKRVEIRCDAANTASQRVPQKLAFTHEATLKNHDLAPNNQVRDTMIFTRLDREGLNDSAVQWPGRGT